MRLIDFEPRWIGFHELYRDGLSFICPHCKALRIVVYFSPPIDPEKWHDRILLPEIDPHQRWVRTGETFETLTLEPSVNIVSPQHWHGRITNGQMINS